MEKTLHILELDHTTIKVDIEPWIILKTNPSEPILRLKSGQKKLIESDFYKGDDKLISYSGENYWISLDMYEFLERKTKKDIDLNLFGVSYAEYIDPLLISNQADNFEVCLSTIEHLKNTNDNVIIVSERSDLELHSDLIDNVRKKLIEYNIVIDNFYLLSDSNLQRDLEDISFKKSLLVLEKMTGYKIIDNKFSLNVLDQFNKVYYYDDNRLVFDEMLTIQETFNTIYYNSDNNIKEIILNKVLSNKPFLKIHQITGNEMNLFKTNSIQLNRPSRIHKFNFFK